MEIHEYLALDTETETISCNDCGHQICSADENYKLHCAMEKTQLEDVGPGFESPSELLNADHNIEFREFYCPSCAVLIDHEIARAEDRILWDIEIDSSTVSGEQ